VKGRRKAALFLWSAGVLAGWRGGVSPPREIPLPRVLPESSGVASKSAATFTLSRAEPGTRLPERLSGISGTASSSTRSCDPPELESSSLIVDKDTKLMAKNQTSGSSKRDAETVAVRKPQRSKGTQREILFPTEPTSIPHEEIDRAIDAVMSRRK
jgi:hypothetical protein